MRRRKEVRYNYTKDLYTSCLTTSLTVAVEVKVAVGAALTTRTLKDITPLPMESTEMAVDSLSTIAPLNTWMEPCKHQHTAPSKDAQGNLQPKARPQARVINAWAPNGLDY